MLEKLIPYKRKYSGDYTYFICSVRKADKKLKKTLVRYVNKLRDRGEQVLYPDKDTNQEDDTGGCRIVRDHVMEIAEASKFRIAWNPESQGSVFDYGTVAHEYFINNKPVFLANRRRVEKIVEEQRAKGINKSYEMVLLEIDKESRNR